MKHILTLAALVFATACFGQEACPNVHDINSNGTIDIEDFLSILGLFADVDVDGDGVWDSQDDCLDATACNYLVSPTEPCGYLDALGECGGACEGDGDGDGICDDVDTCVGEIDECGVCNGPGPTELIVEDIVIDYDSIFLPLDEEWFLYAVSADTIYGFVCGVYGCTSSLACNYNASADQDDGSCVFADDACEECAADGTVLLFDVDGDGVCDQDETDGCLNPLACNYNEYVSEEDGSCEFVSCLVLGCTLDGACNFNPDANINDGSCEYFSCQGCLNPGACNYDETATIAGFCDYASCVGCLDPEADNYDPTATIEGACDYLGCTSFAACNFDPNANVSDTSCEFLSCVGCLNSLACNYDENATQVGSCDYPEPGFDCDGNCNNDADGDGICDELEEVGCIDPTNPGFNPFATDSDPSLCLVPGCTLAYACNYDEDADYLAVGLCDFTTCAGCTDEVACTYNPVATISNFFEACVYSEMFRDCDGNCLNDFDNNGICDELQTYGCTDAAAANYNPDANVDNGTCLPAISMGCVINFACNYDPAATAYVPGACDFSCLYGMPWSGN